VAGIEKKTCFGSGSELDPVSMGTPDPYPDSQSVSGFAIRIRIQKGKKGPEKYKTVDKFHHLKCWMFSFDG
jgi:hypothetical protein